MIVDEDDDDSMTAGDLMDFAVISEDSDDVSVLNLN